MVLRQPPHRFIILALEPWPHSPLQCGHVAQCPSPASLLLSGSWDLSSLQRGGNAPTSPVGTRGVAGPGVLTELCTLNKDQVKSLGTQGTSLHPSGMGLVLPREKLLPHAMQQAGKGKIALPCPPASREGWKAMGKSVRPLCKGSVQS